MKRYGLAPDLREDPELIAAYKKNRTGLSLTVSKRIRNASITDMHIYRPGNRLFTIMDTNEQVSLKARAATDTANENVQKWEQRVWKYQQALPGSATVDK